MNKKRLNFILDLDETLINSEPLEEYDFEKYKWLNIGGQLIREVSVQDLYDRLKRNEIQSWEEVHQFYVEEGNKYDGLKEQDALLALSEVTATSFKRWNIAFLVDILGQFKDIIEVFQAQFIRSRKKDFDNPFRLMMYENEQEMEAVLGSIEKDSFIKNKMFFSSPGFIYYFLNYFLYFNLNNFGFISIN
jgi:hypothetical protein